MCGNEFDKLVQPVERVLRCTGFSYSIIDAIHPPGATTGIGRYNPFSRIPTWTAARADPDFTVRLFHHRRGFMRMGFGNLRKQTIPGLLMLIGIMSLTMAGCGTSSSGAAPLPDAQQIFRFPLNANGVDIKTMDPAKIQDLYSYYPIEVVFPAMLTLDSNGNPYPWAAASMPTFDTTTNVYTFKIRPGLKWSDGTPIDANTFAYSINRSLSPCTRIGCHVLPLRHQRRIGVFDREVWH